MAGRRFARFGGVVFVGSFVVLLAALLLFVPAGVPQTALERDSAASYAQEMADAEMVLLASMWLFNSASVLVIAGSAWLWVRFGAERPVVAVGASALALAGVFYVLDATILIGVVTEAAPFIAEQGFPEGHPFVATTDMVVGVRNQLAFLASALVGVAAVTIGAAGLPRDAVPSWLAYAGIAVGVVGLVGWLTAVHEAFSMVRMVGEGAAAVWFALLGAWAVRRAGAATG